MFPFVPMQDYDRMQMTCAFGLPPAARGFLVGAEAIALITPIGSTDTAR
jgi:hypothetical protein